MPTPNMNEDHMAFMHRCMGDSEAMSSFPEQNQRYAFCSSQWERRKSNESFSKKYFNLKALDVDTHKKRVKIAIAELESIDRDNEIFDPSAFDKTIKENGPKGSNEIWHLLDHNSKLFSALGKFSELSREDKYITGVSYYKDSFAWREVAWPLYEAGDITQHSVGFQSLKDEEPKAENGPRIIREVRLYEGSAVPWGANPNTPTMEVMKRLMIQNGDDEDITATEKIDQIIRKIKNQKRGFTEEDSSLLIIELKYLQKLFDSGRIADIFREPLTSQSTLGASEINEGQEKTTEPETKTTQPETVVCPHCKKVNYNSAEVIRCRNCSKSFVPGVDFAFVL